MACAVCKIARDLTANQLIGQCTKARQKSAVVDGWFDRHWVNVFVTSVGYANKFGAYGQCRLM